MAAARMVLLALSVVLFAAAWSGDRPRDRRTQTAAVRRGVSAARTVSSVQHVARFNFHKEPTGRGPWASIDALPPAWESALPCGVAAGEYQLVETTGRTQRVVLTAEFLQTLGQDPDVRPESIYTLALPGRSAYLIRITPAPVLDRIAAKSGEITK